MSAKTIVLIGAGKVATHLGAKMKNIGLPIIGVWSRTKSSAHQLGQTLNCQSTNLFADLPVADVYLILVKDDAISVVAEKLAKVTPAQSLIAHTSGAVSSEVLKPYFKHYGVFYPLQTFSIGVTPDFSRIPFCIYANYSKGQNLLDSLASHLSPIIHRLNDQQRAYLHLSAVFVNNFTNYLQHISSSVLKEHDLPSDILKPLLTETIKKLDDLSPNDAQTGPAVRGDQQTIDHHLHLLKGKTEWQEIYQLLSKGIIRELKDK